MGRDKKYQPEQVVNLLRQIADADFTRIRKIPDIGPRVATALVAASGNDAASARDRSPAFILLLPHTFSLKQADDKQMYVDDDCSPVRASR